MKRCFMFLMIFTLCISIITQCMAEEKENKEPIVFRGLEWGSSWPVVEKTLSDQLKYNHRSLWDNWETAEFYIYYNQDKKWYSETLGVLVVLSPVNRSEFKVAGYSVKETGVYFIYTPDEKSGLLVYDDEHTALVRGYYRIKSETPVIVYEDLVKKMTALYGQPEYEHGGSGNKIVTPVWRGEGGTMVSVQLEESLQQVYIRYSYSGANDLMQTAHDALLLTNKNAITESL